MHLKAILKISALIIAATDTSAIIEKRRIVPLENVENVPRLTRPLEKGFIDKFPKMSDEQVGHLRHFHNLANQKDGEWRHMGSQEPAQEWLDGYRYQLATMAYAAGATHYFRLPLLRSVFKTLFEQLIAKMLLRDVWGYWFLTSHSGKTIDPDLTELRKPWADPIVKENIMYSGHLLHMVSLYSMLFNDDKYNEHGALKFDWVPVFWGMGPEQFIYNRTSLQDAILKEMERENWLGVCCEPNSIFIVCNQFPIIGMRYNDAREGTNITQTLLEKYQNAWKSTGMFQEDGLLIDWFSPKQGSKTLATDFGFTAWAAAFLNSWNPEIAKTAYTTAYKMLTEMIPMNYSAVSDAPKSFMAREQSPSSSQPLVKPILGYTAQMISELGDESALDHYLNFIDTTYSPTWENGGLFYPAISERMDKLPPMDSFSGNAAIPYARLNVFQGQRRMYEKPWTEQHFSNYPFINKLDLSSGIDFLRGSWNESLSAMALTLRSSSGESKTAEFDVSGFHSGRYAVYRNQNLLGFYKINSNTDIIHLHQNVTNDNLDIVIKRV